MTQAQQTPWSVKKGDKNFYVEGPAWYYGEDSVALEKEEEAHLIAATREMHKALDASNQIMINLHDYAIKMRRAVMANPELAEKGGFTYIDLDSIDDIMLQGHLNDEALAKAEGRAA